MMPVDTAEGYYQFVQIGFVLAGVVLLLWLHKNFNNPALTRDPAGLSTYQLKNIRPWGRLLLGFQKAGTPRHAATSERIALAVTELRRRGITVAD